MQQEQQQHEQLAGSDSGAGGSGGGEQRREADDDDMEPVFIGAEDGEVVADLDEEAGTPHPKRLIP
jgi:hypothetical protein